MFLVGEQLEILQRAVPMVAVFPPDPMPFGDPSVGRFPDAPVDEGPDFLIAVTAVPVGDFHSQVAVEIRPDRADREIIRRSMSLFELRFRHAARGPSRPPQALVRRDVTFFESSGGSNVVAAPQSAGSRTGEVYRAFLQSVARCSGVDF